MNFTSVYSLTPNLKVNTDGRYDLINNKIAKTTFGLSFDLGSWQYNLNQEFLKEERDKSTISAIYNDECTRLTFSFQQRYKELGASEPIKSLMFRVQFKPFANFVFLREVIKLLSDRYKSYIRRFGDLFS